MERKVQVSVVNESQEGAREDAIAILKNTYSLDTVRLGQIVDVTLIERDGRPRHPTTHRPLPDGTRCYDVEAFVPGGLRGWDDTSADDGPLPPGVTRVR